MKRILMTATLAFVAFASSNAQNSDVQHATLNTTVPFMVALRPYDAYTTTPDNQSLSATVTNATDVLTNNNFSYNGNGSYNGLAYKIYSNYSYRVTLQAQATGSNDELNGYINFSAETLPSPMNGLNGITTNGNGDHVIEVATPTRLSNATSSPMEILANNSYSTGVFPAPATLDPASTDYGAFGVKFSVSPGFSVTPGTYTTHLTLTATTP